MESRFAKPICFAALSSIVVGCGGSSGGASQPQVQQGVFLDSAVMGLAYSTETHSGITDSSGTFEYIRGETVIFSLGGIQFGSAVGGSEITPFDLLGISDFDGATPAQIRRLTNILIALQSLDADGNPDNGIDLADLDQSLAAEELDFDLDFDEFSGSRLSGIVAEIGGRLVDESSAVDHFLGSLDASIIVELPILAQYDNNADGIYEAEVAYEYDSVGLHIKTVTTTADPLTVIEDSFEYDGNQRLIASTVGQIVTGESGFSILMPRVTTYSYSDSGKIVSEVISAGEQNNAVERRYFYDEYDRLIRIELNSQAYTDPRLPIEFGWVRAVPFGVGQFGVDINTGFSGTPQLGLGFSVQIPPEHLLGGFSISSSDAVGQYFEVAELIYSDLGHVERAETEKAFLGTGESEQVLVNDATRLYDEELQLLAATETFYLDSAFYQEIITNFSFLESGAMDSCSLTIDGEEALDFVQDTDDLSDVADQYLYSGTCGYMFQTSLEFGEDGRPAAIVNSILNSESSSPIFSVDYVYEEDSFVETVTYSENAGAQVGVQTRAEYQVGEIQYSVYDTDAELIFASKTTTVSFEFGFQPQIPSVRPDLGLSALFQQVNWLPIATD